MHPSAPATSSCSPVPPAAGAGVTSKPHTRPEPDPVPDQAQAKARRYSTMQIFSVQLCIIHKKKKVKRAERARDSTRLPGDGTAIICYFVHHLTPEIYLQNGQNRLPRTGNSSGLRCPTDASLGSITLRNDSARTLAMEKWYPLRHPMVKPYPRRPHENYLYLPYKSVIFSDFQKPE